MAYSQQLADGPDAQELGNPADDVEIGQDENDYDFKRSIDDAKGGKEVPGVLE